MLWRAWTLGGSRRLSLIAAGVAFYGLFGLVPAVAVLVMAWGFVADPATIEAELNNLHDFLPPQAFELVQGEVDRIVGAHQAFGGWATLMSLLVMLWSARLGVGGLIEGVNAMHGLSVRNSVWQTLVAIALTVVLVGVAVIALASVVVVPLLLGLLPLGDLASTALLVANWAILLAVVLGGLALVYRYGLNRPARGPWFTSGLWTAVGLWAVASLALSWFLGNFGNYGAVYGSLAAVIALLFWFYVSAYAVLLGAAVNAEAERQHEDTQVRSARFQRTATNGEQPEPQS